ncbi:hypothetical protein, partial [Klebsiella michiganensis]|uniref:hypothetical protein n=1 Tax=Klebsiella michiganensis TaxID=1134687 RepID=UPI001FFC74C4
KNVNQDDFSFNDSAIAGYGYDEAFRNDRAAGLWWPRRPWLKRFYRVKKRSGEIIKRRRTLWYRAL